MTKKRKYSEGISKESPNRNSLKDLENVAKKITSGKIAKTTVKNLITDGYFTASLMEQVARAENAIVDLCKTKADQKKLLSVLTASPNEKIRAYAAGAALAFHGDDPKKCTTALYKVGTRPGTWPQEKGQMALKKLMMRHGVNNVLPHCRHWLDDKNDAARRMLIEALRPLGVWTGHLMELRNNPQVLKPLLESVLDDPSPYVRKAAANCLNDTSKDNPSIALNWVRTWKRKKPSKGRNFIIRQGMRTLLKAGHPDALRLLGYAPPKSFQATWKRNIPNQIKIGDAVSIEVEIRNRETQTISVRVQIEMIEPGLGAKDRITQYQIGDKNIASKKTILVTKKIPFEHRNSRPKIKGEYTLLLSLNGKQFGKQCFTYA